MAEQKKRYDTVIVGGGASGMAAAISSRRAGASVFLAEKMPRLGRKVLASGNGRCNLCNEALDASFYNPEAKELVGSVFARFGKEKILSFFRELGLVTFSDGKRIFPVTNQAASVVDVLETELARLGVEVQCGVEVTGVAKAPGGFTVRLKPERTVSARRVVLSGGGKSYPAFGADGGAYKLAAHLGHRIIGPVPSAVPLVVKDPWCHYLQGQRIRAAVTSVIKGRSGSKAEGELLFTKYGLSGTAILDVSDAISLAMNRDGIRDVSLIVDLAPFMEKEKLRADIASRIERKIPFQKLLMGILPPKFSLSLQEVLKTRDAGAVAHAVKEKRFTVTGTRGWNEAEFTAGGVDTREVVPESLESRLCPGFYLAGEILNVHGERGGFNLAWAWASGFIAGDHPC